MELSKGYYENRIKSLEEQLKTADAQVNLKSSYIKRLEDEKLALAEENEKLKSALIGLVIRAEA